MFIRYFKNLFDFCRRMFIQYFDKLFDSAKMLFDVSNIYLIIYENVYSIF